MGEVTTGGATAAATSGETTSDTASHRDTSVYSNTSIRTRERPIPADMLPSTWSEAVLVAVP